MSLKAVAIALLLCVAAPVAAGADPAPVDALKPLIGTWDCNGSFPASGRTIASTIRFESDLGGAIIVKHHDDVAPAAYHAIETWSYNTAGKRYESAIADVSGGGVRIFTTDGWHDGVLTWSGGPDVKPLQQFIYAQLPDGALRVDWRIAPREGGALVVGDTLTCRKR